MRLFVICKSCGRKTYLNIYANSRRDLIRRYGKYLTIRCPACNHENRYHVGEVFAEEGVSKVPAGAIVGGLVGLLGGPPGVIFGGGIGALIGGTADATEKERVRRFNKERA